MQNAVVARLLLLPPYSPDFNPIEQAISKVKTVLRKLARRTADALFGGIAEALASVTPTDACTTSNTAARPLGRDANRSN